MKNLKKFNNMGRRRLMGGVVGLGLVALLGAGALTQSALTSHERTLHAPPGKLVSVGTHRLHLNCQGSGQPLVLLESGLSGWSQDWALVQPELAKLTTVCSYDRAGYAWSDDAPEPRTGLLAVQDLRTMLRAAGLQGPMVVVGHSWGGMLAQMLAQTHPEEVAGLVLVDALHHDQTASMDPDVHARYSRNMRLLTGSATWLGTLGAHPAGRYAGLGGAGQAARFRTSVSAWLGHAEQKLPRPLHRIHGHRPGPGRSPQPAASACRAHRGAQHQRPERVSPGLGA
jgi:pimeloyl-ACP methyl ester carboxylesterase